MILTSKNKKKAYLGYLCSHPDYYSHNNQNHHLVVEVESSPKTTAQPNIQTNKKTHKFLNKQTKMTKSFPKIISLKNTKLNKNFRIEAVIEETKENPVEKSENPCGTNLKIEEIGVGKRVLGLPPVFHVLLCSKLNLEYAGTTQLRQSPN